MNREAVFDRPSNARNQGVAIMSDHPLQLEISAVRRKLSSSHSVQRLASLSKQREQTRADGAEQHETEEGFDERRAVAQSWVSAHASSRCVPREIRCQ